MWALVDAEAYDELMQRNWSAYRPGKSRKFYATTSDGIAMHRMVIGAKKGQMVDHVNGDPLDNRRANLRFATSSQNAANRGLDRDNKSGFKGVSFATGYNNGKGGWIADIRVNGRPRRLGYFKTPESAAIAYDTAARKAFGGYAWLNFPEAK